MSGNGSGKRKKAGKGQTLGERFVRSLDLPGELAGDGMTLEMRGRCNLLLCGCREILAYSPECVRVRLRQCEAEIRGRGLTLITYFDGQVGVEGHISGFDILDGREDG